YNVLDRWLETELDQKPQSVSLDEQEFSMDLEDGLFGEESAIVPSSTVMPGPVLQIYAPPEMSVDLNAALIRFDGDREFMLEMCKDFHDHLPGRIAEINSAFLDGDIVRLHRHAHTLKGVSLNFDATYLAELAARLEQFCKHENITDAQPLIHQIELEAIRVEDFLIQAV
ncbi:MAG TPA: Hpt domain-containing protein, partial [Anaerolineales bacterium]|nr:Hpt domain-containing protein [Anaerolineales bacterium]